MRILSAPQTTDTMAPPAPRPQPVAMLQGAAAWPELQPLCTAFRSTGGLVVADQLASLLSHRVAQPISCLARWIVRRQVVSVPLRGQSWLPLFQFQHDFSGLQSVLPAVLAELTPLFSDEELAQWFARGHSHLGGAAPADLVACDGPAVLLAARTDRFLASMW